MHHLVGSLAILGFAASLAHADIDTPSQLTTRTTSVATVGLAVNPPLRWFGDSRAFGASLYVGFGGHHVVRGNLARYAYGDLGLGEATFDGTTTDVGASYLYFPRRAFDGFVVEAGALYRHEDGVAHGPFWDDTAEHTTFYGGRAMLGWSWLFAEHLFVSVQAGASVGHERGTIATYSTDVMDPVTKVTVVDGLAIVPEGMIRIGVAFDL